MKREAIKKLIKDLITVAATWTVATLLLMTGMEFIAAFGIGMFLAGLPFGWRWMSKIITAVSLEGVAMKALLSVFLGWIAIFVTLIGDVIRCVFTKDEPVTA